GHTGYLSDHSLVALVEADGQLNLARGSSYRFGAGDLWVTGMSFGDDPSFVKGSRSYDGRLTGIGISGISLTDYTALAQAAPILAPARPPPLLPQSATTTEGAVAVAPEAKATPTDKDQGASSLLSGSSTGVARPAAPPVPPPQPRASIAPNATPPLPPTSIEQIPHSLASRLMATESARSSRTQSLEKVNRALSTASIDFTALKSQGDEAK